MIYSIETGADHSFDVAVCGGGTAGVFAAISAARCGVSTALIEKSTRVGGTVTNGGVNFPGLFHAWGKQIIAGPCFEAIERVIALGGGVMPEIKRFPKYHWQEQIRINPVLYTFVINEMLAEAGVKVFTDTMLSLAEENEEGIELLLTGKNGLFSLRAENAIDCTGDADLAQLLGYETMISPTQQPATLHNHLTGYDGFNRESLREEYEKNPVEGYTLSDLTRYLEGHKIDNHVECIDADTSAGRCELERKAVNELVKLYLFFRGVKGLENISIDYISPETAVRESRRIVGEHIITAEEYVGGKYYPDSICYAFYPVDLHVRVGIDQTFLTDGVVPKVPYSALIPRGSKHLLCAGRCISSDTYANSALRVQAPCMAEGQAAGCAAAIASKHGCRVFETEPDELRAALTGIGAIVPEKP